ARPFLHRARSRTLLALQGVPPAAGARRGARAPRATLPRPMSSAPQPGLDETVFPLRERLRAADVPDPRVLFLMGTGLGFLPARLSGALELELGERCGECEPWAAQVLHAGTLGGLSVWCLEDASGEPLAQEPAAPWMRALPVWLAAAAGAEFL